MTKPILDTGLVVWYDEHNFSPLTCVGLNRCLTRGMKETLGVRFTKIYDIVYDSDHVLILTPKDELDATVDHLVRRILENPTWADGFNARMMAASDVLLETTRRNAEQAKSADDATLASYYETFVRLTDEKFRFGILPVLAESNEGALSRAYYEVVKGKIGEGNFAAVADLLAPAASSTPTLQRMDLLRLAVTPDAGKAKNDGRLDAFFAKWSWVPYMFIGPAWTRESCQNEFEASFAQPKSVLHNEFQELERRPASVEHKREALMKKYVFDAGLRQLTNTIVHFGQTKYQRKENFTHAHFHYHPILAEMARRLGLSIRQVRLLTPEETRKGLVDGIIPDLAQRGSFAVYEHADGKVRVLNPDSARAIEQTLPKADVNGLESLQGQCACPGSARGKATIVNTEKDIHKLQQGDVLFSYATAPELMAAIRKASAIVTDRGGVTCHAAIVSRELGIPCVIGTKVGTQWIKEGQMVEVDAAAGIVRKVNGT